MSGGKQRSDGSKHSDILVGVALLLLAAVFAYLGFSQPKISNDYTVTDAQTQIYQPDFDITWITLKKRHLKIPRPAILTVRRAISKIMSPAYLL